MNTYKSVVKTFSSTERHSLKELLLKSLSLRQSQMYENVQVSTRMNLTSDPSPAKSENNVWNSPNWFRFWCTSFTQILFWLWIASTQAKNTESASAAICTFSKISCTIVKKNWEDMANYCSRPVEQEHQWSRSPNQNALSVNSQASESLNEKHENNCYFSGSTRWIAVQLH